MTSLGRNLGLALSVAMVAQVPGSAAVQAPNPQMPARPAAPTQLRDQVVGLGRAFNGKAGIAIISLRDGWEIDWNAGTLFPQQSCSKLWVAITALDAVDHGQISLSDKVTLGRSDLTLFHQPLREKILGGGHTTTLGSLMFDAITESDNTANDKLMRSVGGPEAVRSMIASKHLGSIRFYNGERALQSRIAGLIWSPSYSIGNAFYEARDALPQSVRQAAFKRYVEDPYDGAAPSAIVNALARLKRGELLSPASTQRLLDIMSHTKTGANRLKGGLAPGWVLNHKTGTGQVLGTQQAGYNDIGILTAPDGRSYSVAVMIKLTSVPLPVRMTLMNNVVRSVIIQHDMQYAAVAQQ